MRWRRSAAWPPACRRKRRHASRAGGRPPRRAPRTRRVRDPSAAAVRPPPRWRARAGMPAARRTIQTTFRHVAPLPPVSGTATRRIFWRVQKRISAARIGGRVPPEPSQACTPRAAASSGVSPAARRRPGVLCLLDLAFLVEIRGDDPLVQRQRVPGGVSISPVDDAERAVHAQPQPLYSRGCCTEFRP